MPVPANIELISNFIGQPSKIVRLESQTIRIIFGETKTHRSADGIKSGVKSLSTITWEEGKASDLSETTHVKITGINGQPLIGGSITNHFFAPRNTENGVEFQIK